jgi:hypothetical protein
MGLLRWLPLALLRFRWLPLLRSRWLPLALPIGLLRWLPLAMLPKNLPHGGNRGREHGVVLKRGTLNKRTPSRGGQAGPAVFRRLGRLQFS